MSDVSIYETWLDHFTTEFNPHSADKPNRKRRATQNSGVNVTTSIFRNQLRENRTNICTEDNIFFKKLVHILYMFCPICGLNGTDDIFFIRSY